MDSVAVVSVITPLFLKLVFSLILAFVGYLLAKGAGFGVTYILKLLGLDMAAKFIGLAAFLEKGEVRKTVSDLLGGLVYWAFIFLTVVGVAKVTGIPIKPAMITILSFTRTVFVVSVIIGMGLFLGPLLSGMVKAAALNLGIESAKTFARIVYYVVVIFAFLFALAHLGIKTELIAAKLDVIIGAFGLAAAIAFGLGCKDMAADFLHNLFKGK